MGPMTSWEQVDLANRHVVVPQLPMVDYWPEEFHAMVDVGLEVEARLGGDIEQRLALAALKNISLLPFHEEASLAQSSWTAGAHLRRRAWLHQRRGWGLGGVTDLGIARPLRCRGRRGRQWRRRLNAAHGLTRGRFVRHTRLIAGRNGGSV